MTAYLVQLRRILSKRFSVEELRTFCFDLDIDYDDLPATGKAGKARELVAHLEHHDRILECLEVGKQLRPDIPWERVQLALLEEAQRRAADPRRFQPLIDELQDTLMDWEDRVEQQRTRIAEGLEAQRQQRAIERAERRRAERLRVVGQPPLDVADYFKDRERDLQKLRELLAEPTVRLVSVIGHGGMGKTALACKVLQDMERHRWPHIDEELPVDGLVYLSTRTAGISLERLFLDCAKLLGSKQEEQLNAIWTNPQLDAEKKIVRLLEALSEGRYVILLDNLEDLLDDQGQLTDDDLRLFFEKALITSSGAQLVVTSRVALAFRREMIRFDQQVKLLEGLPIEESVALLRELDPNGDYGLRDAPQEQLVQAVELTHGVPRALEVLAGILANDPFATLDEVLGTFYEQKDVVQALIEENYRRLDRDTRRVIEALAVFRRPVPPLAVDYLLEPFAPGLDVPCILRRLTRTNIVSVDRTAKTVTLHPIDQDYAYSQLLEEGEEKFGYTRRSLERRAADYYVQLRTPEETWKSIEDLEPQLNEFEHRVHAGDCDEACQVLKPIDYEYLYLWGHYDRLIRMRARLVGHLVSFYQMDNLGSLGRAYYGAGELGRSVSLHKQCLEITRKNNYPRETARQLGRLGVAYRDLGQVGLAIDLHTEALDIARHIGDKDLECLQIGRLGLAYRTLGRLEQALEYNKLAIVSARENGDRRREGNWLGSLGLIYHKLGQFKHAIECHRQALKIVRGSGDRRSEGANLGNLGLAYRPLGMVSQSIDHYKKALSIAREIGDRRREAIWLHSLAVVYCDAQIAKAIELQKEALDITVEINNPLGQSYCLMGLGKLLLAAGSLVEAQRRCAEARDLDAPETSYKAALILSVVLLHWHMPDAKETFTAAATRCRAVLDKTLSLYEPHYILATALVGQAVCDPRWADASQRPDLLTPALAEYRRALDITAAPGIVQDAIHDLELIQAADIEGLEPIFELLRNAEYEPDLPEDLSDILEGGA